VIGAHAIGFAVFTAGFAVESEADGIEDAGFPAASLPMNEKKRSLAER